MQFDRNIYAQKAARPPHTSPLRGSLKALFISKAEASLNHTSELLAGKS